MAVTAENPAPYATGQTIRDLLRRYRERGLASPVTREVLLRAGVSDSLVPRTLQSLVGLELIDDEGKPTDTLEGLRLAPSTEYQQRAQEWLKAVYADVFQYVDPATDDETAIRDAFRSYKPVGQQDRMVNLFISLCEEAGLREPAPKNTKSASKAQPTNGAKRTRQPPARHTTKKAPKGAQATDIPAPIHGLLQKLPSEEAGWTKDARDRFLATFGTVLDFCYPIRTEEDINEANGNGED